MDVERQERKQRLLYLARRTRNKWIMDAAKEDVTVRKEIQRLQEHALSKDSSTSLPPWSVANTSSANALVIPCDTSIGKASTERTFNKPESSFNESHTIRKQSINISLKNSLQNLFDLLNEFTGDGEWIDIETIDGINVTSIDSESDEEQDEKGEEDSATEDDRDSSDDDPAFTAVKQESRRIASSKQKPPKNVLGGENQKHVKDAADVSNLYGDTIDTASPTSLLASEDEAARRVIPFVVFLKRLQSSHPTAVHVVKATQSFVMGIYLEALKARTRAPAGLTHGVGTAASGFIANEDAHALWAKQIFNFLPKMLQIMRAGQADVALPVSSPWTKEPEPVWRQTASLFERFLFIKLFPILFGNVRVATAISPHSKALPPSGSGTKGPYTPHDGESARLDDELAARLRELDYLTPAHLDIAWLPPQADWRALFADAVAQLARISDARDPRDMLACVRRCTVCLAQTLSHVHPGGAAPGTDDLLPLLILALQQAQPLHLHSCIQYIQRYIRQEALGGESGYLLTQVRGWRL